MTIDARIQVTICAPYASGDVRGKEGQALNHVRKIVDKFYKDEERRESGAAGAAEGIEASSSGQSSPHSQVLSTRFITRHPSPRTRFITRHPYPRPDPLTTLLFGDRRMRRKVPEIRDQAYINYLHNGWATRHPTPQNIFSNLTLRLCCP